MPQSSSHAALARLMAIGIVALTAAVVHGQEPARAPSPGAPQVTGRDTYRAACATCHGMDGIGVSRELVGFAQELPDFTDCSGSTRESYQQWNSVIHDGGRARAFAEIMPSFGPPDKPAGRQIIPVFPRCSRISFPGQAACSADCRCAPSPFQGRVHC